MILVDTGPIVAVVNDRDDRHREFKYLGRVAELVAKYDDLPLGPVDASVIAVAKRLNITTVVVTLDFGIVRPAHVPTLGPAEVAQRLTLSSDTAAVCRGSRRSLPVRVHDHRAAFS